MPVPASPPRRILLATDLSGRCDRALDRAAQLAAQWEAKLVVVHALEWDRLASAEASRDVPSWRQDRGRRAAIAERQIHDDLLDHQVPFEIVIEEGEPTDVVLQAARRLNCDMIVTGTARSETFGRLILGATVDRLVRRSPLPVLVVKARAHRPYARVMVATDFSDGSRLALQQAAALFPQSAMTLLHCYRPISPGLTDRRAGDEAGRHLAADESVRFLDGAGLAAERRQKLEILIEPGYIESVVQAYAADKGLDLLVVGSQGRGGVAALLLGSTAEKLLASSPCDVLIARGAIASAGA